MWLTTGEGQVRLRIPAGDQTLKFRLWFADAETADEAQKLVAARAAGLSAGQVPQSVREASEEDGMGNSSHGKAIADLAPLTRGGLPHWTASLQTQATLGDASGPFAVDVLSHPARNPWLCRTRFTGFDFFADGQRAAICSWDGDVWLVRGVDRPEQGLSWQRIASGLFQPLGLKIVRDQIYVGCRDQIVILRDLNGDGETDFYENFNNDHQVTDHFHEFAMGLQTDAAGNFYYAKGARHALPALVPHHGTLLRVSADGSRTEILANGFPRPQRRLPQSGRHVVCDRPGRPLDAQEPHQLDHGRGGFYGNFWGYHDVTDPGDELMLQPVGWITNAMDRSPAELVWVDSDAWGPLKGALLNTSYGYGMLYIVPHEVVDGQMQGGVCPFPLRPFPTGIMRVRFHPQNGQLYTCGMFAWAGNQTSPADSIASATRASRSTCRSACTLDATACRSRSAAPGSADGQGSEELRHARSGPFAARPTTARTITTRRPLAVTQASLSADGRTVTLQIPQIQPTWCMEIKYWLKGSGGENVNGTIHNTIHRLPAANAEPK